MIVFDKGVAGASLEEILEAREKEMQITVGEIEAGAEYLPGVAESVVRRLRVDICRLKALILERALVNSVPIGFAGARQLCAPFYFRCDLGKDEVPF